MSTRPKVSVRDAMAAHDPVIWCEIAALVPVWQHLESQGFKCEPKPEQPGFKVFSVKNTSGNPYDRKAIEGVLKGHDDWEIIPFEEATSIRDENLRQREADRNAGNR